MQRIISKVLIILILIVILFEFICSSNICYAVSDVEIINSITNLIGGITAIILWIPRILVTALAWAFNEIMTFEVANSCGRNFGSGVTSATPFDIFFNKYKIFDVNFFDIGTSSNILNKMRGAVAQWFYILRLIATAILLCILIYVGIRMAISTVADEKAKYIKMFWDWCASLALMFVLPYIIIFTITANNAIVSVLKNMTYNDISDALDNIAWQATLGMGIGSLVATFVYCMIVFQTIAFMLTYIQRMLKVGFLIVISPLISITYSIDKIGDGKAQALNTWLKEFVYTILIQPFHCIMYLAFVNTAIGLISTSVTIIDGFPILGALFSLADGTFNQLVNGILAILCLKFINDGEKAIRKIFNFKDDGSMTSMAFGAALAMATIQNAQKIGKTTAAGVHKATALKAKFDKARQRDAVNPKLQAYRNSKLGKAMNNLGNKVGGAVSTVGGVIGNGVQTIGGKLSSFGSAIVPPKLKSSVRGAARWASSKMPSKETMDRIKNSRVAKTLGSGAKFVAKAVPHSMPMALGIMGAAMSYATGSSGVLEAIGAGSGLQKGSEEFFTATKGNIKNDITEIMEQGDQNDAERATLIARKDVNDNLTKDANIDEDSRRVSSRKGTKATQDEIKAALEEADILDYTDEQKAALDKEDVERRQKDIEDQRAKKDMAMLLGLASGNDEIRALALQRFMEERRTPEGIKRAQFVSHNNSDIMNKKNEILKKILDLKSKSNPNQSITDDDMDYADRTMTSITGAIEGAITRRTGLDINKLIESQTGEPSDYSDEYQSLYLATLEYDSMMRASAISQNMNFVDEIDLDDDKMYEAVSKKLNKRNKTA